MAVLIKALMQFAVEQGYRDDDPTISVKKIKFRTDGIHSWSEDEIAQFEGYHGVGTKARLALALLLHTAQRRSDVIRMGRQHVRDTAEGRVVDVRQQKTGAGMAIPLHPELPVSLMQHRANI